MWFHTVKDMQAAGGAATEENLHCHRASGVASHTWGIGSRPVKTDQIGDGLSHQQSTREFLIIMDRSL